MFYLIMYLYPSETIKTSLKFLLLGSLPQQQESDLETILSEKSLHSGSTGLSTFPLQGAHKHALLNKYKQLFLENTAYRSNTYQN